VSADDLEWKHLSSLGVRTDELRALIGQFGEDLEPAAWGFGQLADIDDEEQRAVVSDLALASALAIKTNLFEGAYHLQDFDQLTAEGMRIPRPEHWIEDHADHIRAEMAAAGFFRAFGSALDCLAAVAIVTLRIPTRPQRADVNELAGLAARSGEAHGVQDARRRAWREFAVHFDQSYTVAMRWALETRNAIVHRARHIGMNLPRPPASSLLIVASDPMSIARDRARSDLYFRRYPWLPEVAHIATTNTFNEQILNERASVTMRALFAELQALLESSLATLRRTWVGPSAAGELAAPAQSWSLPSAPDLAFDGVTPHADHPSVDFINANPATARRMALGEQLRVRRGSRT
jgi:hypothetical protein